MYAEVPLKVSLWLHGLVNSLPISTVFLFFIKFSLYMVTASCHIWLPVFIHSYSYEPSVQPSVWESLNRLTTDGLGEDSTLRHKDRKRRKQVKSKGVVTDSFTWGKKEHHFVRSSQASPARPSGRSSVKMKMFEEDVRMVTVVAWNRAAKF
jgi:hypothetical protein